MSWKLIFVAPTFVGLLLWTTGCGGMQSGKTVHGTAEAFKKAESEKGGK